MADEPQNKLPILSTVSRQVESRVIFIYIYTCGYSHCNNAFHKKKMSTKNVLSKEHQYNGILKTLKQWIRDRSAKYGKTTKSDKQWSYKIIHLNKGGQWEANRGRDKIKDFSERWHKNTGIIFLQSVGIKL